MTNILGIANTNYRSHDNAACIVKDGKLVAAAEEERFTREKHAYDSLPINAVRFCLGQAGLNIQDVDVVTVGWDLPNLQLEKIPPSTSFPSDPKEALQQLLPERVLGRFDPPEIHFVPHHLAHAAAALYASGFKSAAVIVLDGAGEFEATTHWQVSDGQFRKLVSLDQTPHSLGFMFEGVSKYLGFKGDDAGKVMGLASYSNPRISPFPALQLTQDGYRICFPQEIFDEVAREYSARNNYYLMDFVRDLWISYCKSLYGNPNGLSGKPTEDIRKDIAMRLQKTLETALLHSAAQLRAQTGEKNLCLAGGVALNCSANGQLERAGIFDNVYVYPASNDAGTAIGSALYEHHKSGDGGHFDASAITANPFLGPEYSDTEILDAMNRHSLHSSKCSEDFSDIAQLISEGAVVGWFQGRAEIGPRALGGRSILANPRRSDMHDKVNNIKRREQWRPLAPSILEGYEGDFFEPGLFSPFMLKAAVVKPNRRVQIPAVTHVDGTCRYQSVRRRTNPKYWELIESFRRATDIPMVLNTSFNDKSEPIVCSPDDAIKTFLARPIDCLVMNYNVVKK